MRPGRVHRRLLLPVLGLVLGACVQKTAPSVAAADPPAGGCLPDGQGRLEADLRGAIAADLLWNDAQMQCDGDLRPDGSGLRIALVGPLDASRSLRFIFGIDLADAASGPARVLPTNLTVLIEGEATLFATRGADKCAVEELQREPVSPLTEKITVRGYCLGPASDLAGEQRLLVPTFSFTALARRGDETGE